VVGVSVRRIGRFDIFHLWPAGYRALQALENSVEQADLDPALLEIVRTRVSQVNACSFCLDMHAKAAIACGEDPLRLIQLSAWREADCYSDAERAALALAEELTHCSAGVTDATISSGRWTLLSAPSGEKQWPTAYTVIDWATRQRGPIDIIGGGIGLRSQSGEDPVITDTLAGLEAGEWELSHRHRIPLSAYVVEDG